MTIYTDDCTETCATLDRCKWDVCIPYDHTYTDRVAWITSHHALDWVCGLMMIAFLLMFAIAAFAGRWPRWETLYIGPMICTAVVLVGSFAALIWIAAQFLQAA